MLQVFTKLIFKYQKWDFHEKISPFIYVECIMSQTYPSIAMFGRPAALRSIKSPQNSFHTWKLSPGVIGLPFYSSGRCRPCVSVCLHLLQSLWHHGPPYMAEKSNSMNFSWRSGGMNNSPQSACQLCIYSAGGSHFSSRWMGLPDLTLRFVGNVKHFEVKHAWVQRKADMLLHWTPDASIIQKEQQSDQNEGAGGNFDQMYKSCDTITIIHK